MKRLTGITLAFFLASSAAFGQAVQQSGAVTNNTSPIWSGNGLIKGGNSATDSPLTTFGVTRDNAPGICVSSDRASAAGRNQLCLSAATSGPASISLQNYGTASAQNLQFVLNGVALTLPAGGGTFITGSAPYSVGHAACFMNTSGVIQDCGGTPNGVPFFSATGALSSTAALTNGQMVVGQTGGDPTPRTLSGDVGSVTAAGALTLTKVNGIPFNASYTAHGVLLGEGSSAFSASVSSNVGYCLLSQGVNSDPIWAACASGSGAAGGSNTQVQFNSGTSLGASANFTWVSPALTIGVAGSTTGQLALASSTATGTVSLQAPGVSSAYNFNFPTGAGSSGQPLLSGGGGSTPNTFGTLGVSGGGTACNTASGTCLDNISALATTGYLKRTGAGTYTTVSPIPVSDGGTSLASGTSGGILGFTASGTIASSAVLAANGFVIGGGAGATPTAITACSNGQIPVGVTSGAPVCQSLSGDVSAVTSGGAVTIANSAITVAKQANAAAYTLAGNFTASSVAPQFSTIGALTQKVSPAASDLIILQDQAAAGALKYATVSSVASAGSVSSIAGNTGAFTLANGIDNSANQIQLTAARRTLPTTQSLTSGTSATYTTPANCLWIEVFMVGGGGGGGGAANGATLTAGSDGTQSTFNSINAAPGKGGLTTAGGLGGTGGTGTATRRASGSPGENPIQLAAVVGFRSGGFGGASYFGGGAMGGVSPNTAGSAAIANSGSGGGGAANAQGATYNFGAGGGGGEFVYLLVNSPSATYTYTIGGGGAGGVSTANGGTGGSGYIFVVEHYGS